MKIDQNIVNALDILRAKHQGTTSSFYRKLGLTHGRYFAITNRNKSYSGQTIGEEIWEKLYVWLEEELPDDLHYYPRSKLIKTIRQLHTKQRND